MDEGGMTKKTAEEGMVAQIELPFSAVPYSRGKQRDRTEERHKSISRHEA